MSIIDFDERRQSAESRLDTLRRERGAAVLFGGELNRLNGEIVAAEAEIEALREAEGEVVRVEREAAAKAYAEAQAAARTRLAANKAEALARVTEASEALAAYGSAMRAFLALLPALQQDVTALGGTTQPLAISEHSALQSASSWLSHELARVSRHQQFFGSIKLHHGPRTADSWRAAVTADLHRSLAPLLGKE